MGKGREPRASLPVEAARGPASRRRRVASEPPPDDDAWRYRSDGPPRWLALLGVAAGFLLFVVPGVFALRSYRRWRQGMRLQPAFAWVMGVVAVWTAIVAAILLGTDFIGLAWLAALIGPLASVVIVLRS
jgi:hypothetical protein